MERIVKLNELLAFTASFPEPIAFNWTVVPGSFVYLGMQLGSLLSPKQRVLIVAHVSGIIRSLPRNSHDSEPIAIAECEHEISCGEVCISCGEPTKEMKQRSYGGLDSKISYSRARALKEERKYLESLFKSRKLMLVLDIDHTLVHTCSSDCPDLAVLTEGERFTDETGFTFIVKLRPFLSMFLETVGKLFDVYVYSHGSQRYAESIVALIDPEEKTIRQNRIFGRESTDITCKLKTLENLLPADQTISIIIDDREDVWANRENLIRIFPFVYFNSELISYDRSMYPALSYRSQDCSLLYFSNLLRNLHNLFYDLQSKNSKAADMRIIISYVRSYILKGTKINLTALENSRAIQYQKTIASMGGSIQPSIQKHTILLVNKYTESEAVREAESKGGKVADVEWLVLSERYWWKLPLDWFLVGKDKVVAKANEMELASAMQKKLQEGTYWMYEFHNEVLKGILDNETIDNVLNKKKKIEE
eukprot:TRINITY_DN2617_c0_g2_i3.p1 TRINITY_DN2617_c0_g2~~TRINITY_DN2617_c0_g2_i3.p1  ORF type:complete len:478 (+),score=109.89 TRINITY_DN2617_c0_g2_i3:887-2320(+)